MYIPLVCYVKILSGHQPFEFRDVRELKENVCIYKLRPQRYKLNVSCPDWLWNLMSDCWKTESKERKSLDEIMKILNNPPSMEENNDHTLLQFANMKRSQSFLNKSLKVNSLINKLNKHRYNRSSSKINEISEKQTSEVSNGQAKLLSNRNVNEKKSFSDVSVSTMSSAELESYIQSLKNNSVTALLSDSELSTLKFKSFDDEDEFEKVEMEKLKKRNRRSLSSRLSFRSRSSSIYNVNVYSGGIPELGKSFIISNDGSGSSNNKHRHRSSTMKKWSLSPEHFLSISRKTYRKDTSNLQQRHEKVINELPTVEEPGQIIEEEIIVAPKTEQKIVKTKIEEVPSDDQEVQTIANSQEELTEKEKSATSVSIENDIPKDSLKPIESKISTIYPSPENSVHAV